MLSPSQEIILNYKRGKLKKGKKEFSIIPTIVPEGNFEIMPVYPGCEDFLGNSAKRICMSKLISEFVVENFNSKKVSILGVKGNQKIAVMFKIDKTGNITSVKARSPYQPLTQEAIKVVKELPKMKPGSQMGKPVVVQYALPILFSMD